MYNVFFLLLSFKLTIDDFNKNVNDYSFLFICFDFYYSFIIFFYCILLLYFN